jgi:3-dehydrosphinganine reductase
MKKESRIVITGGSSGLGLALAAALSLRGASVALIARDGGRLAAAAAQLRRSRAEAIVHTYSVDVAATADLTSDFERIAGDLGGIDVLVNCAGILREGYFDTLAERDFREVMDVNCFGALRTIRAALPHLERSRGRILNVASIAALTGVFGYAAYCASKHALLGASDALRAELTPRGITVQVACPGEFESPMVEALDKTRTPENRAHTLALPRTPVPAIVSDIVRGLESDDFLVVPGSRARAFAFGIRHFPGVSRRIGDGKIKSAYVGPRR